MSIRTTTYALEVLEADTTLPSGARKVLMATSIRANVKTSATFTGDWLCRATGLVPGNVGRALRVLAERGYLAVDHRPGLASIVRFPVAGFLAAAEPAGDGRTDPEGQFHPAFCACPWCLEQTG